MSSSRANQLTEFLAGVTEPYVVMGVGLPMTGKSHDLRRMSTELGVERVDLDVVRQELYGQKITSDMVWQTFQQKVAELIRAGQPVIVDASHIDPIVPTEASELRSRRQLVETYKSLGAKAAMAVVFNIHVSRILEQGRITSQGTIAALRNQQAALYNRPVTLDEGFDVIATKDGYNQPITITDVAQSV
jgi:predicted kinase